MDPGRNGKYSLIAWPSPFSALGSLAGAHYIFPRAKRASESVSTPSMGSLTNSLIVVHPAPRTNVTPKAARRSILTNVIGAACPCLCSGGVDGCACGYGKRP